MVSIAAKDFEVSRFLLRRGCFEELIAHATSIIRTTGEERLSWELSRGNQVAELLCIASRLKEVCCATPLLRYTTLAEELEDRIVENLTYLGGDVVKKLLWIATHKLPELGEDPMKNVDVVSRLLQDTFLAG